MFFSIDDNQIEKNVEPEYFPFQDYSKMRPKYIKKTREQLNDENSELMGRLHSAQQENIKNKKELQEAIEENQNLNKSIKDFELYLARNLGVDKFSLSKKEASLLRLFIIYLQNFKELFCCCFKKKHKQSKRRDQREE